MERLSTLCYIEQDGKYLMLHRTVKKNDVNKDKWIGVGGHFEHGESPEECLLREVKEETGYTLTSWKYRGIVTFVYGEDTVEYMSLYTADGFTGEPIECDEGELEWVDKEKVWSLELWEGDKIFFRLLDENQDFFSLKLVYDGQDKLVDAALNGESMELFDILNPDGTKADAIWSSADRREPEVYSEDEMSAIEQHIKNTFGEFENVFHELVSPDIHVDICIVPPTEERGYYTLVTMGMGAHRMNVPKELEEYKLERAELAIALPPDWKLDEGSLKDERWYWPIGLLKVLARLPISNDTWLGFGHTMGKQSPFAENTKLCGALLVGPQDVVWNGGEVCTLPSGEEVNFYQVIPLYHNEMEYKMEHDADALLEKMAGISFVVDPARRNAIT